MKISFQVASSPSPVYLCLSHLTDTSHFCFKAKEAHNNNKTNTKTNMKLALSILASALAASITNAFVPSTSFTAQRTNGVSFVPATKSALFAKYKDMDEILALFPDDKPVLINFYDSKTENDIKNDIMLAKNNLAERCSFCSIRVQDYPDLAKLWDADFRSPTMILFRDGRPLARFHEVTDCVEIMSNVGKFC